MYSYTKVHVDVTTNRFYQMLRGAWSIIIVNFNAAKPFGSPASNNTAILE